MEDGYIKTIRKRYRGGLFPLVGAIRNFYDSSVVQLIKVDDDDDDDDDKENQCTTREERM